MSKRRRSRLRKTDEQFKKEVYNLVGNEYEFLEEYAGSSTKILCKHQKCQHEYKVTPSNFLRGRRCPACSVNSRKTNKVFKKEVYDLVGNEYEFLEKYKSGHTKISCKHKLCGHQYEVSPSHFLAGSRCPKCALKARKKTNEDFTAEVYALVGNNYTFLEDYEKSGVKILCRHEECGHVYSVTPNKFLMGRRCPECDKYKSKTNEDFIKEVYGLVGEEYIFLEDYLGVKEKISCKHKECGSVYRVTPDSFLQGSRCPSCSSNAMKSNEEFLEEIYSIVGDEYDFLEDYTGSSESILCRHNSCGNEWKVQPHNFIINGNRCPNCGKNARKTNEEFVDEVEGLVGKEYVFLEEYVNSETKILCRHTDCGREWRLRPKHFLQGTRCPVCSLPKGEYAIRGFLKDRNTSFQMEYSFPNLTGVGDGLLRFDFAIFDDNDELTSLIEYDGEFHFKKFYEEQNFEQIQIHDKRKNQYCKDNNIPLLRIPYWDFDNIEELVEEFLQLS